jgi:uncharacterized membrane protein YkvA (DUF1232 family)
MKENLNYLLEKAIETWKKLTSKINIKDIESLLSRKSKIFEKFKDNGKLSEFLDNLKVMFSLVKDYKNGTYREIPFYTIAAIVAALLYVLNPFDVIPDFIPFFGYVDDLAVLGACLTLVRNDLNKYRNWKNI